MKNNINLPSLVGQECTGCSVCSSICPTKAIDIELTKDGFYEPIINDEKCISCSLCKKVCYKFDDTVLKSEEERYKSFSAINKNEYELKTATSGGVSIELMRQAIKDGYKVVGVAYDYEKDIAETRIVSSIAELEQFKGSKYFQSYTENAFSEIIKDKTDKKYAIFGTPCQIYGISKIAKIKKNREKYLFVDICCHGCPSLNIWKKYLNYSKKKFKVKNFDKINFRSKVHGWHEYAFEFLSGDKIYKSSKLNDQFHELFFDMNTHNKACYECKMRSSFAYTDIRLGDFWGHQYDTDTKGVSAVIISSKQGKEIFTSISDEFIIVEHSIAETVEAQSYGKEHKCDEKLRKNTLDLINSESDIKIILKEYRKNYSVKKKIKLYSKNIVKCLPKSVYFEIKKAMHKV